MTRELKEVIHEYDQDDIAQKHETQYLPSAKKLMSIVKNFKSISRLSTIEAIVEFEYLTLICLHHRRNYYRFSTVIPDFLYDDLEARVEKLREVIPKELNPLKHILLDNVGY